MDTADHVKGLKDRVSQRSGSVPKADLPVTIKFGVPLLIVLLAAYFLLNQFRSHHVQVAVVDLSGKPVTAAKIEFFEFLEAPHDPSPGPKIGEMILDGEGRVAIGEDAIPGEALVRISAAGYGAKHTYVSTSFLDLIEDLTPPGEKTGRVTNSKGGPIAGAKIICFGGGQRGVPLLETMSAADGSFTLSGYSTNIHSLFIRVLAKSFAVREYDWSIRQVDDPLKLRLIQTESVRGKLVMPEPLSAKGHRLLVHSVPGVQAETIEGGVFLVDHLPPPPKQVRLLISTVPEGFTHKNTLVRAGATDVVIAISKEAFVEGQVLDLATNQPVAGASVVHEHGPKGREVAVCDGEGRFRIGMVPPGKVSLRAELLVRVRNPAGRPPFLTSLRHGWAATEVSEGQTRSGISISLQ